MHHNADLRWLRWLALGTLIVTSAACHRVIIDSGLEPATTLHHEEWNIAYAHAIYPAKVDALPYCGGRWARVETKQSFLNFVVDHITMGIISPMDVKVVCAGSYVDGAGRAAAIDSARLRGTAGPRSDDTRRQ